MSFLFHIAPTSTQLLQQDRAAIRSTTRKTERELQKAENDLVLLKKALDRTIAKGNMSDAQHIATKIAQKNREITNLRAELQQNEQMAERITRTESFSRRVDTTTKLGKTMTRLAKTVDPAKVQVLHRDLAVATDKIDTSADLIEDIFSMDEDVAEQQSDEASAILAQAMEKRTLEAMPPMYMPAIPVYTKPAAQVSPILLGETSPLSSLPPAPSTMPAAPPSVPMSSTISHSSIEDFERRLKNLSTHTSQ